ncbi:Serine palmitoyltransferase 1 [Astathelohania contejeani]|uniref:serine C-palmitoyltransferase n=1 Tax=Astathelohania contejeani TaxID=164912 RepID=A0ABQ7HWN5_9MICR|nr:Serine palmitoyltransferase 1 [Thelohania contejeani]
MLYDYMIYYIDCLFYGCIFYFGIVFLFIRLNKKKLMIDSEQLVLNDEDIRKTVENFTPKPIVDDIFDDVVLDLVDVKYECTDFDIFNLKILNKELIRKTIKEYGVGTCGPPGFYGTLDLHLELEQAITKKLQVESAILYSNSYTCINSVVMCFCRKDDIVFYHIHSNEAIIRGLSVAKCRLIGFIGLADLIAKLKKFVNRKYRNFILTEALLRNTGEIIDIAALISLKHQFGVRLIIDESLSFPLLGPRGISSYASTSPSDIDIIIGSLAHVFSANGGFSAGAYTVVDYQRLSSKSYCFSASLPGFLAKASLENIEKPLNPNFNIIKYFHRNFNVPEYTILSSIDSPIIIITKKIFIINTEEKDCLENYLELDFEIQKQEIYNLQKIKKKLLEKEINVAIIKNPYPSIRINLKVDWDEKDVEYIIKCLIELLIE